MNELSGGGGGTGGNTGTGSGPNTGGLPPMGGETLGFPNWFPFPQQGIWDVLLPDGANCDFAACGFGFQVRSPIKDIGPPWIFRIKYKNYFTIRLANPLTGKACIDIDVGDHGIGSVHCWDWSKGKPIRNPVAVPTRIPGPVPVIFNPCAVQPSLPSCLPKRGPI